MKNAPIGSCWVYAKDDNSMYRGQTVVITYSHRDALEDYDYEGWMTPLNRMVELLDLVLSRHFKCISMNEKI